MSRVILITGCSSGFGREIALLFAQKKWKVIATMRNIEDETFLKGKDNITRLQLDVTNSENIKSVVEKSINAFNQIDVLVNNAGYGTFGFFEEASEEEIMKQINTNQLSMIRMMQVILPHFRKNKRGKIINISSSAGRFSLPYTSLYNMTKFAIEGLSESLYYEYLLWNINVKIIEPGYFKTKFYDSALFHRGKTINDFDALRKVKTTKLEKIFQKSKADNPELVAKTVYNAVLDKTNQLRYTVGKDVNLALRLQKILPPKMFLGIFKRRFDLIEKK